MLSGLAQAGVKALGGERFSLVNLLPATVLVGFVTLLVVSGAYDGEKEPDLGELLNKLAHNAGWAVIAVFAVFLLAVLLRPFQAALVQLLEGYWERWPMLDHVTALAIERHRRKLHTTRVVQNFTASELTQPTGTSVRDVSRYLRHKRWHNTTNMRAQRAFDRYPRGQDRLLPTLLGNVLRDGEDNAGYRYGLRLQVVGPRLTPSLSSTVQKAINQNLDLLDTTAAMCVAFATATVVSLPLVTRWDLWSLIPLAILGLSVLAYRGAVRIAIGHGSLLATAIDLHRFDMIKALHHKLPTTPKEEQDLNQALSDFLERKVALVDHENMRAFHYEHPKSDEKDRQVEPSGAEPDSSGGGEPAG